MFTCWGCGARPEGPFQPHDKQYLRDHYQKVPVDPDAAAANPDAKLKDLCVLGGGRHGKVKQARRLSDGQLVAIKSQHTGGLHVWGARRARGEEAMHLALELPHVVRILDVADTGRKRYIIQELGKPIRPESIDTVARAVQVMRAVLVGVQELHSVGVYHRDIKLANVLEVDGVVKVTDFGKAVASSGMLEATYAWADGDGACIMFHGMLARVDTALAAQFKAWWKGKPNLRVEDLLTDWLEGDWLLEGEASVSAAPVEAAPPPALPESRVPGVPPSPPPEPAAPPRVPGQVSSWSSVTYPLRHGWEKSLAYWPLVVGPGTPRRWDPVAMGTDPQGGPQADKPAAGAPARPKSAIVRVGRP